MERDLGAVGWQLGLFAVACLVGIVSYWTAKRYRRWLIRELEGPSGWVLLSSILVGLISFTFLAVSVVFVMDSAASV